MDYKKKYLKYKLKYLTAKKMLGGDGRLPNCTLSKDVLEGFKGGMEGTPPQTPEQSLSPLSPLSSPVIPNSPLTIEQMIEKYNDPKTSNKRQLLIDISNHIKQNIINKLIETVEDGLKAFMIIELGYTGFNFMPPGIFDDIVNSIEKEGYLKIMTLHQIIDRVVAQIKEFSQQRKEQWIAENSDDIETVEFSQQEWH